MSSSAAGPWVVVVGMHRSGTSAVTGAIGALGFNVVSPQDRLSPHDSNPEHWESLSVLRHSDAVLAHFGGTWDAPPQLTQGWENDSGLPGPAAAAEALHAAYPGPGPSVWKDPRLCLLLPYWRAALEAPMVAILVWRPPLAVARSLRRRDGSPIPYGVALWERYNRSAIANLAGTDVYVLSYDDMVEDPGVSLRGFDLLARFDRTLRRHAAMGPWRRLVGNHRKSSPRVSAAGGRRRCTSCWKNSVCWLITSPSWQALMGRFRNYPVRSLRGREPFSMLGVLRTSWSSGTWSAVCSTARVSVIGTPKHWMHHVPISPA